MQRADKWVLVGGLVLLYVIAVGLRLFMLEKQYVWLGQKDVPFGLESALQFRMTEQVANGALPEMEPKVQWPEGVSVRETYSIGAEYLYAYGAKLLPDKWSFVHRVRIVSVLIFCLGVPALAFFAGIRFRSWIGGGVAGLYYGIALSGVIRSNGLELSRENLGLPLMCLFLAATAWNQLATSRRQVWISAGLGGLFLAWSIASWDMIQYFIALWVIARFVGYALGRSEDHKKDLLLNTVVAGSLFVVGWLNPYLRAHAFYLSPALALLLGMVVTAWAAEKRAGLNKPLLRWMLPLIPVVLVTLLASSYGAQYNHFADLLKAKIAFMNVKPQDPGLLNFNQRIMWTPQLDSATLKRTWMFFRFSLYLGFTSAVIVLLLSKRVLKRTHTDLIFYFFTTVLAYVLFVRFQAYLAVFMALCIGGGMACVFKVSLIRIRVIASVVLVLLGIWVELGLIVSGPGVNEQGKPLYWSRPNTGKYKVNQELIDWFQNRTEQKAVVANFGTSAELLAYADCPIVLHPKFEGEEIRDRVEEYGKQLFLGTEESLRDWVNQHNATYLVFSRAELNKSPFPEYQMRYMVDALKPPATSPASRFHRSPNDTVWFTRMWSNKLYTVYKVVSEEDEEAANDLTFLALQAYGLEDLEKAQRYATMAGNFWPRSPERIKVLNAVGTERLQKSLEKEEKQSAP